VAAAVLLSLALTSAERGRAAGRQDVWLHYDYMVAPDGTSLAPDPKGIDLVVQVFKAHGIDLHIDPQHAAIPTRAEAVYFDVAVSPYRAPGCLPGNSPPVDFSTLRNQYFHPISNHEWHYALFVSEICGFVSGVAQLPGDDFVVAAPPATQLGDLAPLVDGSLFMHELGHNLGLHHGGNSDVNYKPNYLSVMNYWFNSGGIPYANSPGSTDIAGYRLDYSEQALPTLDENHLDEQRGLGATGSTDISVYCDPTNWPDCGPAPVSGPVDWNQDGVIESDVRDDLDYGVCATLPDDMTCGYEQMSGFDDWAEIHAYLDGQTPPGGTRTVAIEPPSDQPLVTGISTATGPSTGGTNVTISGVHLKNVDAVEFGTCPAASFAVINEHTITATTPPCDRDGATVDVTVSAGPSLSPSTAADLFTFVSPYPVVTSVTPGTIFDSDGAHLTITGRNFTGTTEVDFGTLSNWPYFFSEPSFRVVDDSTIVIDWTGTDPFFAGSQVGSYPVVVHNAYGTNHPGINSADLINLIDPPPAPAPPIPTVTSVTPVGGPEAGGNQVVIRGTGFQNNGNLFNDQSYHLTSIRFGSANASAAEFLDDDTILATAPPGTGTADVTVTNASGTSATNPGDLYTYGAAPAPLPAPQITDVTPASATRGTLVTITGSNLAPGPGAPTVQFTGCKLVNGTVNADGSVSARVPPCATDGQQGIALSNEAGQAVNYQFTVTGGPPPLTITGFAPTQGPPGTAVTFTGDNVAYVRRANFGCGMFYPRDNADGSLTAIVPTCAITGPVQLADVNGDWVSPGTFTVTP
jgi:hypothetical protein